MTRIRILFLGAAITASAATVGLIGFSHFATPAIQPQRVDTVETPTPPGEIDDLTKANETLENANKTLDDALEKLKKIGSTAEPTP